MAEKHSSRIVVGITVTTLILIAEICRHQKHFGLDNEYNLIFKPVRVTIYLSLFIAWGISVERRIINRQLRMYLRMITILIVFWFSIRTVRLYFVIHQGVISRMIWYGSYTPIIMIPTLMLFAAMHTRQDDSYRLPGWSAAIIVVSAILSAIVAVNDFHYRVFRPKGTIDMLESWYAHTVLYWLIALWIIVLTISALCIIFLRCRVPHSRRIAKLPILIFTITCAYFVYMMADYRSWKWVFGDYTPFLCLAVIGILESCISSGMIPSNSGYGSLFKASPVGMLITDEDWNVHYRTGQAVDVSDEELRSSAAGPVMHGRSILLKSYPLRAGHAVWQEDITELADTMEQLETNRREIAEGNYLDEHSYRTISRLRHTQEQNRLYGILQRQTAEQMRKMHEYLDLYDSLDDIPGKEADRRKILAESAVMAAYVKRKGNLIFHGEKSGIISTAELRMCIGESMQNLRLLGIECHMDVRLPGGLSVDSAIRIYDMFECIAEFVLEKASLIYVRIGDRDDMIQLLVECEIDDDSDSIAQSVETDLCVQLDEYTASANRSCRGVTAHTEFDRDECILRVTSEISDDGTDETGGV